MLGKMSLTKEQHLEKDRVLSALSKDGKFRISVIKNTNTAREAQRRHYLPLVPAILLSKALASASLLAVFLKGEERIIIDVSSDGVVSKISAEAIQVGEVRGLVEYSEGHYRFNSENYFEAVGNGILKVIRILYYEPEPIVGIVELIRGDIASDLSYYFAKSEQIFTIVLLDAVADEEGIIANSCGLVVQSMPGATEKDEIALMTHFESIGKLTDYINPKSDLADVLNRILPWGFDVMKNDRVDFFCRCSKESFIEKLFTFDYNDLIEMKKNGQNELVCRYCNAHYYLTDEDFERIINVVRSKN